MTLRFIAGLCIFTSSLSANEAAPAFFAAKPGSLAKAKERLAAGDKDLAKALKHLVEEADEALQVKPTSVMDKTKTPPSGDKHDKPDFKPELCQAALVYGAAAFETVITNHGDARSKRFQLLFVK